ncbi:MAG: leucyl aminopeptidase [Gammaproteobacteria bacterium]|nr:leucyl aminopeptidase [Gammaproteobacteria bacterium]
MDFSIKTVAPEKLAADCVVIGISKGRKLGKFGKALDKAGKGHITTMLKRAGMDGESGQVLRIFDTPNVAAKQVLAVGCGAAKEFNLKEYKKLVHKAVQNLNDGGAKTIAFSATDMDIPGRDIYWQARFCVETVAHASYSFNKCKSEKPKSGKAAGKFIIAAESRASLKKLQEGLRHGLAIAKGVAYAKDLGNLPGNHCTPSYLAQEARKLGKNNPKLKVSVLDEAQMKKLGMGALLSVSKGSRQPAKMIFMQYQGAAKTQRPHALVGKGLTFDAGGISLKPAPQMDEMKFDMCGGASVLGAFKALLELKLPINAIGAIPSSENLPDGNANKPGDVVTSMSGQTIEILNTDAEGRLILCDALTYVEKHNPQSVIDIATLTGACVISLGAHATGLMSNDDKLTERIKAAGEDADDRVWQLPLWEEYQAQLKSNVADIANIGGREAGTITAACFLSRFTKKMQWAHLDVAGTAWQSGSNKGSTGRPVSLLVQYLLDRA